MRFVAEVIFFTVKFYRNIYFHGQFLHCVISFFSFTFMLELKSYFLQKTIFSLVSYKRKVTVLRIVSSKVFLP